MIPALAALPLKTKLIAGAIALVVAAAAGFAAGWTINGWRLGTTVAQLETSVATLSAQGKVLAHSVEVCNAGVDAAAKAGAAAVEQGRALVAEARRLAAGSRDQAARLEALLAQPTPAGAGCREAWAAIEADSKARAPR